MSILDLDENKNAAFATVTAVAGTISSFYEHLEPWLLLGLVLVFADLRFGIKAARRRGETIRPSRACRRTINKSIDYLCWVTVAEVMSRTFGVNLGAPVVSMSILFLIYGIEINSCVNNYLEYKGISVRRFNIFRLIGRKELDMEEKEESAATEETTTTEETTE